MVENDNKFVYFDFCGNIFIASSTYKATIITHTPFEFYFTVSIVRIHP